MISFAAIGVGPFDTNLLSQALILATPILLAGIGELISERAGVINVGLEGMMLSGAFFAYLVDWKAHSAAIGLLGGIGGGLIFAVIMGLLAIEAGADQIVAGVAITLAAIGLTGFLFEQIFQNLQQITVHTVHSWSIPVLTKIPSFGPALFNHDPLVFLAFILVPIAWFLLFKTRWGLAIRAAGELPSAVDSAGISVRRVRWMGVLCAGGLAGLAGADLSIVQVGIFHEGMSAGLGYLALVAVIFGRWKPVGVLAAALVLGGTNALQLRVGEQPYIQSAFWGAIALIALIWLGFQARHRNAPSMTLTALLVVAGVVLLIVQPHISLTQPLWVGFPYAVALLVLAGSRTAARMPSALSVPYRRGQS
ncbi:MAG TPA: ABC transporter permease [Solirubrobacteraceae bacterium]|jgi:simple sugar transport system permease protein